MLIEEVRVLGAQIKNLEAEAVDATVANKYSMRAEQLHTPVVSLRKLISIVDLLRRRGVRIKIPAAGLRKYLKEVTQSYESDQEAILDTANGPTLYGFWEPLSGLPDMWETQIKNAWKAHVNSSFSKYPDELVDALAPGSAEWTELQEIYNRVEGLQDVLPSIDTIAKFDALVDDEKAVKKNLGSQEDVEELLPFISKAQTGTANLEMVTEELKEKLEKSGISELFRVVLKENQSD